MTGKHYQLLVCLKSPSRTAYSQRFSLVVAPLTFAASVTSPMMRSGLRLSATQSTAAWAISTFPAVTASAAFAALGRASGPSSGRGRNYTAGC